MELWTLWKLHRCYLEDCFAVGSSVVREVGRADLTCPAPGLVEEGREGEGHSAQLFTSKQQRRETAEKDDDLMREKPCSVIGSGELLFY